MKEGERVRAGRVGSGGPPRLVDGRTLSLEVLRFFGQDPEKAAEFFELAGLDPQDLRAAIAEPAFLPAALDFITADDRLLERFAQHAELRPIDVAATAQATRERESGSAEP